MKTRRLIPLLTLAYLFAMLASNVTPIVSGANTSEVTASAPVVQPAIAVVASADPVMTQELMDRLIKRTMDSKFEVILNKKICAPFNVCVEGEDILIKQITLTLPDGKHYFIKPLKEGSKDILITLKRETSVDIYLTDREGTLRAAAISDEMGIRLITNETAAEMFKAELKLFATKAQKLPPTETDQK
jgi:hypothetical protein